MDADRFKGQPQAFDPEHHDLDWHISEPLPYYSQRRPSLLARLAVLTIFRRDRCRAHWWCSWPATERGGTCDPHVAHIGGPTDG